METNWAALEGVRGILALTVLGIHTLEKDSNFQIAINHAVSPVSIFIILSGFSCARGYATTNWNCQNVQIFYKKRFKRILPVYLLSTLIMIAFAHATNVSIFLDKHIR